jgi:peptidoglycan/xylan/chitin deacetylase (PgdA/CDA1 family)
MAKKVIQNKQGKRKKNPLVMIAFPGIVIFVVLLLLWFNRLNLPGLSISQKTDSINPLNVSNKATIIKNLKDVNVSSKAAVEISNSYGKTVQIPILTYHYVSNNPNPNDKVREGLSTSPKIFEEHMEYIYMHSYTTITLEKLYLALEGKADLPKNTIILTFDDGYIDFYVNVYPILRRYNLNATAFISPGLIGQGPYIDWDQIKEMDKTGLISFQAHTVTHPDLTKLTDEKLKWEIEESKIMLQNFLGKPVNFFAYPFGYSNARVWKATKEAGFFGAVSTLNGKIITKSNFLNIPRISASGNPSLENFAKVIEP